MCFTIHSKTEYVNVQQDLKEKKIHAIAKTL